MKISYNWLKRYTDVDLAPEEVARLLTTCGLEVESWEEFETVKGGLKGVIIGKVLECTRHPNADKLSLTKVDAGTGRLLSIVCGAPNVAAGQVVPVALVGTMIHMGDKSFEIKEAKIRGEFSEGMICAEDELGLGIGHEGIMVLEDPKARIGMPASEYFRITSDIVFEIGLTPNRTDATSHIGVARDLVAVLNNRQDEKKYTLKWPDVSHFNVDNQDLDIPVVVEDPDACPRYSGVTVSGIKVGPSPAWLKNLLSAAGIRPINNVVDITNFVLMEVGQPLHAFDAKFIEGKKVVVRKARKGEKFTTLDEVERELTPEDLMICNVNHGMCIGGVFGGLTSGVTEGTTDIFLESAHFHPATIRKTSRYHGLQTDASFRFERGSDPNITLWALKRAAILVKQLAGGAISSEIKDVYPEPVGNKVVTITFKNVNRLIGKVIPPETVRSILADLGIQVVKEQPDGLVLSIPAFKVDVTREADVIEEILRIYGYDNVEMPENLRVSLSFAQRPDPEKVRNMVADLLISKGFTEIMNNSLTRSRYASNVPGFDTGKNVRILNPLSSDLDVMRQSLLFGGMETIIYNINRKTSDLEIFEFGRSYAYDAQADTSKNALRAYREHDHLALWITGERHAESWNTHDGKVDFFDLKAAVDAILVRLGFDLLKLERTALEGGIYASGLSYGTREKVYVEFGQLDRKVLKVWDIRQEVYYADILWENILRALAGHEVSYREVPKFPEVRRDLALVLDREIPFADIEKTAYETERRLLKRVNLFDVYEGDKIPEGKKSYAISFILLDEEKTLTDTVIEKTMEKLLKVFGEKFGAVIR
jgi:phenylalanyl-tRNA synthetase beta chain